MICECSIASARTFAMIAWSTVSCAWSIRAGRISRAHPRPSLFMYTNTHRAPKSDTLFSLLVTGPSYADHQPGNRPDPARVGVPAARPRANPLADRRDLADRRTRRIGLPHRRLTISPPVCSANHSHPGDRHRVG